MNWNFTLVDARGQGGGGGGDLGFSGNIVSVQSENLGRWVMCLWRGRRLLPPPQEMTALRRAVEQLAWPTPPSGLPDSAFLLARKIVPKKSPALLGISPGKSPSLRHHP